MNFNCSPAAVSLCAMLLVAWNTAKTSTPVFLDCTQEPISLCIQDTGVRLPSNNKFILGENHPDATSCSVHISRQTTVQTNCPGNLTYEVNIYLFESAEAVLLQSATTVTPDSLLTAALSFDSEFATDELIKANGIPYTTGCARYHRVVWSVTDACGESSECEMLIDVYDCSKPIHTANALQVLTSTQVGYLDLHLSDFVIPSSDDCTSSGDYLYSFLPDSHVPDSVFHICDFNTWGVEIEYPIWIADPGRDFNCDSVITWNERQIFEHFIYVVIVGTALLDCDPDTIDCHFVVEVVNQLGEGIKNVSVTATNNTQTQTFITGPDGIVFEIAYPPPPLEVTLSKKDFHKNGVSSLDLYNIVKHLLGIQPFTSPYQFIAADVSSSAHVSAIDLIIIRKLILGIIDTFPGGESWKFVRDNFIFPDTTNPWFTVPPDSFFYCQNHSLDYIGIKLGDLNFTAIPNANNILPRNDYPVINWITDQKHFTGGEEIEIPVYAGNLKSIQGFQLTFSSPDLEFLGVHSNIIDLEESFALFGNHLTMSWIDLAEVNTQEDDILFILRAKALNDGNIKESLSLNSTITKAELYTQDEEIYIPQLMVRTEHQESFSTPNPWTDKTSLAFTLDKSGNVQLEVLNIDGKTVFATSNFFHKGENSFEITASDFAEKGMLIYQLRSGDQAVTGKMVKL